MNDTQRITNISDIFDRVLDETDGESSVTIDELMGSMEQRSYGPLLLLPGILAVSPVGAIPGMSIITGSMIILVAGQALTGRGRPWLPAKIRSFTLSRDKLASGITKARPWVERIENHIKNRWLFMTTTAAFYAGAVCCILLATTFYPLALVPMAVSVPGTAIIAFSLGWTAEDGMLVSIGFVMAVITVILLVLAWPF